jgi:MoxR-like ATPase
LKNILDVKNPIKAEPNSEWKSFEEITGNYVFTADNFVKMVLILLRIRSNIPVIMMGETGCGKTSLIRKLSELKNNGNANKMKILNIHAGTTDKNIINFIENNVIKDEEKLEAEDEKIRQKGSKENFSFFRLLLFTYSRY